jgi:4-hydroxythreonine-4-phosphate dehydrogenase
MATGPRPLALTMGEPAGIAGEITIKAWHAPDGRPVPAFGVLGDADWLRGEAHRIKSHSHVIEVASMEEAGARFHEGVPVLSRPLKTKATPGKPESGNAAEVVGAIEQAVALARGGEASGVVTNPIHKATLYKGGFKFPGHT